MKGGDLISFCVGAKIAISFEVDFLLMTCGDFPCQVIKIMTHHLNFINEVLWQAIMTSFHINSLRGKYKDLGV